MKIWVKTLQDDKIIRDCVYEKTGRLTKTFFERLLRDACELIDIPCPIVLSTHFGNFSNFNMIKFLPSDFVESVNFQHLIIENITEE